MGRATLPEMTRDPPARSLGRSALRGPFALDGRGARLAALGGVVVLTLATQIGGAFLWPVIGLVRDLRGPARWAVTLGSVFAYVAFIVLVLPLLAAPLDRVPLPCAGDGPLAPRSLLFCLANRSYVRTALRDEAMAIAEDVRAHDADATVFYLDGAFPFGGPILPHLSHGDGRRLDLALAFAGGTGSPIGYLGYAPLAAGEAPACAPSAIDRRWDLDALQPLFGPPILDVPRTALILRAAVGRPGVGRVLIEPHVERALGVRSSEIQFQGCRAARHDDHMHLELARDR